MNIIYVLLIIFVVVYLMYYLLSNKETFNNPTTPYPSSAFGYNTGMGTYCLTDENGNVQCFQGDDFYSYQGGSGYANFGIINSDCGGNCDQNILERRSQQWRRSQNFTTSLETPMYQIDIPINIVD